MKKGKGLYSVSGFIVAVLLLEVVAVLEVLDLFYQADNHNCLLRSVLPHG